MIEPACYVENKKNLLTYDDIKEVGFIKVKENYWPSKHIYELEGKFTIRPCISVKWVAPAYWKEGTKEEIHYYRYWRITNKDYETIYIGYIKNKKEFIKLLDQLTIINQYVL